MSYTHWVDDDQQSIIGPCSQFHATVLQVEREMEDNNLTVTFKDGRRVPCYHPGVLQQDFGFMDDGEVTISTAEEEDRDRGEERKSVRGAARCSRTLQKETVNVFTCCIAPGQVSICRLKGL